MVESNKLGKWADKCGCGGIPTTNRLPRNSKGGFSQLSDRGCKNGLSREAIVIVGGELNGHVGQASNDDVVHGNYGYGVRAVDGDNIVQLAGTTSMKIENTMSRKPALQLIK